MCLRYILCPPALLLQTVDGKAQEKYSGKSRPLTCQQISTEVVVCGVTVRIVGDSSGAGESKSTIKRQKDNCVLGIIVNVLPHQLQCITLHKQFIAEHAKSVLLPDLLRWVLNRHYALARLTSLELLRYHSATRDTVLPHLFYCLQQ